MNLLTIVGNLTREPELREVQGRSGMAKCCEFSVAVNDRRTNSTEFVSVTVWGALAEVCAKYLTTGKKVGCYGRAKAVAWMGKDGKPRAKLELKADSVEFLSSGSQAEATDEPKHDEQNPEMTVVDEELPF